jgi:photosystem II stability/assembly factor-like uncharacterized protein
MICKLKHLAVLPCLLLVFNELLAQPAPTPGAERMKSLQMKQQMKQTSPFAKLDFRNIGPTIMGGRVVDLEVNPSDPTEFYIAYATGGLWHSTNNGQSLSPIFDSSEVIGIGDIAVDWKSRTIWLGSGEVNSSRSSYSGMGVYKSNNNGKTWDYMGLPESHHIGKIQLHPTDANTAWVAVLGHLFSPNKERGVYKTVDGGKTWKQTLAIDENTGVVDMDLNPQNPNELYAAAWYRVRRAWNFEESGKTSGIYKSTDGGNNWSLVTKAGSGFINGNNVGRIGIAVYPKNPSIIYAVVDNQANLPDTAKKKVDSLHYSLMDFKDMTAERFEKLDDLKLDSFLMDNDFHSKYTGKYVKQLVREAKVKPTAVWDYLYDANTALFVTPITGAEVYRSEDAGVTWKRTNTGHLKLYNTYGYYFGKIYVSPVNENKLVITGFNSEMSTDGGKTFKSIDKGNVHPDHHACWINPNRDSHMIIGNDGGANITYDDGKNWFKIHTPAVGQFYAITVDQEKPYNVYGGLQDNGSWYGPKNHRESIGWIDDGEYAYKAFNGGDGMQVQVDNRDSKTIYTGFQYGWYARITKGRRGDYKSIHPTPELGEELYRYNWQAPIQLSSHNQDILYYGSNRFHRSLNKGDSVPAISADLSKGKKTNDSDVPYATLTTISESPLRFGLIYAGTDDGNVQVSFDGGVNFKRIDLKLPQNLYVSRVVASMHKESRVYVTLNGYRNDHFAPYVFVSNDYGENWTAIAGNLPMEPVNVIREDTRDAKVLYVGTDGGVYASMDAGKTYVFCSVKMPNSVPVHDLVVHARDYDLVVGTHGRSIYVANLDSLHKAWKQNLAAATPTPAAGKLLPLVQDDRVVGRKEE